jgi:hypothetical protein
MTSIVLVIVLVLALGLLVPALVGRRRGYALGGRVVVRCSRGHLFETLWVPGASLKAVRLGWWRLQWCPVGRHVTLVRPVRETELTEQQRRAAHEARDVAIP